MTPTICLCSSLSDEPPFYLLKSSCVLQGLLHDLWPYCAAHLIVDGGAIEMLQKCDACKTLNCAIACTSNVNSLKEQDYSWKHTVRHCFRNRNASVNMSSAVPGLLLCTRVYCTTMNLICDTYHHALLHHIEFAGTADSLYIHRLRAETISTTGDRSIGQHDTTQQSWRKEQNDINLGPHVVHLMAWRYRS